MIKWIIDNKEWLFSGLGIAVVSFIIFLFKKRGQSNLSQVIKNGNSNVQIGNINISNYKTKNKPGRLEIINVGFTHNAELDISLRNNGDEVCIINKIEIEMLKDHMMGVRPMLHPSAAYQIPVKGMIKGEKKYLDISHYVDARKADRFLISLNTTLVYTLKVVLHYNKNKSLSFTKKMWSGDLT